MVAANQVLDNPYQTITERTGLAIWILLSGRRRRSGREEVRTNRTPRSPVRETTARIAEAFPPTTVAAEETVPKVEYERVSTIGKEPPKVYSSETGPRQPVPFQ